MCVCLHFRTYTNPIFPTGVSPIIPSPESQMSKNRPNSNDHLNLYNTAVYSTDVHCQKPTAHDDFTILCTQQNSFVEVMRVPDPAHASQQTVHNTRLIAAHNAGYCMTAQKVTFSNTETRAWVYGCKENCSRNGSYECFIIPQGWDSSVGTATRYGTDDPGIESRWEARFSAPVQTDPRANSASYRMGTGMGELSYLAPLGSENIPAPYFKQCFFRGGGLPPTRLSQTPRLPVPRQK